MCSSISEIIPFTRKLPLLYKNSPAFINFPYVRSQTVIDWNDRAAIRYNVARYQIRRHPLSDKTWAIMTYQISDISDPLTDMTELSDIKGPAIRYDKARFQIWLKYQIWEGQLSDMAGPTLGYDGRHNMTIGTKVESLNSVHKLFITIQFIEILVWNWQNRDWNAGYAGRLLKHNSWELINITPSRKKQKRTINYIEYSSEIHIIVNEFD